MGKQLYYEGSPAWSSSFPWMFRTLKTWPGPAISVTCLSIYTPWNFISSSTTPSFLPFHIQLTTSICSPPPGQPACPGCPCFYILSLRNTRLPAGLGQRPAGSLCSLVSVTLAVAHAFPAVFIRTASFHMENISPMKLPHQTSGMGPRSCLSVPSSHLVPTASKGIMVTLQ